MTPLETAARAAYESTGLFKWEEVRDKVRVIAAMRAALMALADRLETEPDSDACIVKLRSIASEGKDK